MKMIPLYRVSADFHSPMFFRHKVDAEIFIMDKPFATMDKVYCYNETEVARRLAQNGEW
jgi:hypothetical protein